MNIKEEILTNLNFDSFYRGEVKNLKTNGNGKAMGICPFHEDKTPSFSVNLESGLFKCFGSCEAKGDIFTFYQKKYDVNFKTALKEMAKLTGVERQPKPVKKKAKQAKKAGPSGEIVETYDYVDHEGILLYQVCRMNPKSFPQRRPKENGKDWAWNLDEVKLVLYKLPDIQKAEDVFFCEGEKDTDNVIKLGFDATCNPMGAGKLPGQQKEHKILDPLKGKRVFALPHNDEAGKKHILQLAELLHGKAKEIKIINLPGLPEAGGDVSNFIEKHGAKVATKKLIEQTAGAPAWKPASNFLSADELLAAAYERKTPIISRGIMPANSHIIISGESGIGKSLLRLELALHLVMGWEWLGFEIPTARKVSIFQFENTEYMEQTRLRRMCVGLEISALPKGRLSYVDRKNRINLTLKKDRKKLLELVQQSEAEVIIYDCLSNLHTANENDNIQMRDVLDSLTEINAKAETTCILIHHFGKPTEWQETKYRTRGAQSIIDWAVSAMAFTVKKHEHKNLRQLQFIKVRDGAEPKPMLLERDEKFLLSITDEDSLCPASKIKEILEDLGGHVETQKPLVDAIVKEVECTDRSARKYLKRAVEMKVIQMTDHGKGKKKSYDVDD